MDTTDMSPTRALVALALMTLALTGCSKASSTELDDATLATQLRAAGIEPPQDIASWRTEARRVFCEGDEDTFALSLTLKEVTPNRLQRTRTVVSLLCPARQQVVDRVIASR